MEPHSKCTS